MLSGVPKLPEMIAPAWPSRAPFGADRPPMNATTGLFGMCSRDEIGRRFFGRAADLAGDHDRVRLGIVRELAQAVDEGRADDRVAADPDAGRLTRGRRA